MTKSKDLTKLPSLDGWRAISISMVLLAHSTFTPGFPTGINPMVLNWFGTGGMGVRFFFVISGFLITWLMLQEQEHTGGISLRHFYLRRVLRIFPVYFLYLFVLGFLTHYSQSPSAWLANVTFTTNFFWKQNGIPTDHLWSLGVEEQFYLIWPCLLILGIKRAKKCNWLLKMLLVPLLVAPAIRLLDSKQWYPAPLHFLFQGGSFFASFDSLAYGCIAAVLFIQHRERVELLFKNKPKLASWTAGLLILAPTILRAAHFPGRLQAAMFASIQGTGFALLLLQSILHPHKGFYRVLNWTWIRHIGVLSYSIYIWQEMFCGTDETVFNVKGAWWVSFPVWILVTLLVAHASYYLVEKPLFKLRARFRD